MFSNRLIAKLATRHWCVAKDGRIIDRLLPLLDTRSLTRRRWGRFLLGGGLLVAIAWSRRRRSIVNFFNVQRSNARPD